MSELLPCPFCGGEAVKLTSIDGFTSIGCLNCNPFYGVMIQATTETEAIAAWNSRAERTCHIEWRDDSYDTDAGYERDGAYFCTACGADLSYPLQECWDDYQAGNYEKPFNYCPSCGCKVIGG